MIGAAKDDKKAEEFDGQAVEILDADEAFNKAHGKFYYELGKAAKALSASRKPYLYDRMPVRKDRKAE